MFDDLEQSATSVPQADADRGATPTTPQETAESSKEINFRLLRERAERAERRLQELETQRAPQSQEDDDFDVDDEGLVEGKQLKKYAREAKIDFKQTKQQLEALNSAYAEMRLKAKYPDFDQVVTPENVKKLSEVDPVLYRSMMANPDLYEKGEAACKLIKSFVMAEKYPEQDKRLQDNRAKPRAAGTSGQTADTPLAHVNDYDRRVLTEERKEQLRRQVADAKRHYL